MAGKKKEGLGALKSTTGGQRRDDRQVLGRTTFEPISIDAKNALTVIYMLRSPEEEVVLRAVASLDGFAQKAPENMKLLCSLQIFQFLLPLVHHGDFLIKRFSQKLIGMLCSLQEFREEMFKLESVLQTFVDILQKETDAVMHEYSALTLAELSSECHAAPRLLQVENCIETLFLRITSADPDVEKNCLDVMNHLLNYVDGVEAFVESSAFEIKLLLDLIPSSYPAIQVLAIEILKQLTSWCRDTRVLFAFRDATGIEIILEVLENEDWTDLHVPGLDLLINVVDSPELCDYLIQSGCLLRLVNLMDVAKDTKSVAKILGVLARMSQTHRGRLGLHAMEMDRRFGVYLKEQVESFQEPVCLGIANLAQYGPCLNGILPENPTPYLLEILINGSKDSDVRTVAAFALSILCNEDVRASEALLDNPRLENLFVLLTESADLPVELCKNVIQIFVGISLDDRLRLKIIRESFVSALLSCLCDVEAGRGKDASLQTDALECLSTYMIEWEARSIFDSINGVEKLMGSLRSRSASVRECAGHLVVVASQSKAFAKTFIQKQGLEWMLLEKNTMYSMPSWQSAIEAIFAACLPAKFAYTGRLDFQDVTEEGFYIASVARGRFFILDDIVDAGLSPIYPIYVANFQVASDSIAGESEATFGPSSRAETKPQRLPGDATAPENLQKFMKGADRNSLEEYKWSGSLNTYNSLDYGSSSAADAFNFESVRKHHADPFLSEYLDNLKQKIAKEEFFLGDANWHLVHPQLVGERAKIIAQFVADEMSGPDPDPVCSAHYKQMHLTQMKFHLGTNVIPLGYIRMGGHLERALLFKVLSDRLGFPCALVRGPHGRAWIEIAIPVINAEDPTEKTSLKNGHPSVINNPDFKLSSKETFQTSESIQSAPESNYTDPVLHDEGFWFPKLKIESFKAFPNSLLKPNAIVDLIDVPGRILKINSPEAHEYCGTFLFSKCS